LTGPANGPPPIVWWSIPVPTPQPCDGSHVAPSSSVVIAFEQASSSCELIDRPVSRSVHRIGSSEVIAVGSVTSVHVA
jgi:hypothetical protein